MVNTIKFGRIELIDERDKLYPVAPLIASIEIPHISKRYWWADGIWLNQGSTSQCTAYAFSHWLEDGPVIQSQIIEKPIYFPNDLYLAFQKNDGIAGTGYRGSTVRAGAKVLKKLGFIKEYRWANNIDDVIKSLLIFGPVVVGTTWYSNMMRPDSNGIIKATGHSMGGHAYLLNGVDTEKEIFRIKNSWGKNYGDGGHAYISFDDFEKLLKTNGECCVALESKLDHVPSLDSIENSDTVN